MKNTTKIALAGLLSAAGSLLNALAAEYGGADSPQRTDTPEPGTPAEAPKKTRGKAAAPTAEKPAEPAAETPAEPSEEPAAEGKSYEELRALIEPLVKGGQGEDVKKVIAKYGANLKEVSTKPQTHAAFEKDLAALSY